MQYECQPSLSVVYYSILQYIAATSRQYTNREIRAKITVKEKHVAVTGWFKICVFKYWNVHSCTHDYILLQYNTNAWLNISILSYAYFKSSSHSCMFSFEFGLCPTQNASFGCAIEFRDSCIRLSAGRVCSIL
jgi:hypothetical protein